MTDALPQEVAGFGIKVTLVEPGGFATDWSGASAIVADAYPAYAALHENMAALRAQVVSPEPVGFKSAILKVVDAEVPPKRVFFGEGANSDGTAGLPAVKRPRFSAAPMRVAALG